jgi:hypothetical protein
MRVKEVVPLGGLIATPHRADAGAGGVLAGRKRIRETERSEDWFGARRNVLAYARRAIVGPLEDADGKPLAPKCDGGGEAGRSAAYHGDVELGRARR